MDLFDILYCLAGIVVTIVIGYLFYAKGKSKKEITFYLSHLIPLSRKNVTEINGLEIRYNNQPVKNNLILIRFVLQNTGSYDIPESDIQKFTIKLVEDYVWMSFTIINKNKENIKPIINGPMGNSIELRWTLMRKNEFLVIDAVVEQQNQNQEWKNDLQFISFDERVVDLKINKQELNAYKNKPSVIMMWLCIILILLFALDTVLSINDLNFIGIASFGIFLVSYSVILISIIRRNFAARQSIQQIQLFQSDCGTAVKEDKTQVNETKVINDKL